jgi:hypothetical protein
LGRRRIGGDRSDGQQYQSRGNDECSHHSVSPRTVLYLRYPG